ncbi:MAG: hypothetical protein ACREPA_01605 [Candidatus Dormibacteraceae bacterium]
MDLIVLMLGMAAAAAVAVLAVPGTVPPDEAIGIAIPIPIDEDR